ncbi:hypothetical protein [Nocardioides sp. NPDC006273]|uniref:hypothetical protein n=1 Tax=Nocardioides sp. NPDC006273 TaxID=3155598 RepID=UPI0033AFEB22
MPGLSELFDAYSLRARVYPGLLTVLPITVIMVVLWPQSPAQALWPVAVSVGGMFFLTNWVRDRGLKLEKRLVQQWDGLPTTRRLRWADGATDPDFERRRTQLEKLVGIPLPSAADEDGERSDAIYLSAVRGLRIWVRQRADAFPLVQQENAAYGFRRNLLALKPIGIALCVLGLIVDGVWAVAVDATASVGILGLVHGALLVSWITVVCGEWVRDQGERYADQLFDALLSPTGADAA